MAVYGAILNACPVCEIPTFENAQTWWFVQYCGIWIIGVWVDGNAPRSRDRGWLVVVLLVAW